jgi:hypothetical protein
LECAFLYDIVNNVIEDEDGAEETEEDVVDEIEEPETEDPTE